MTIASWLQGSTVKPMVPQALPQAADVVDELWLDADPNVALWALMVQRQLDARRGARLLDTPRTGLPGNERLEGFLRGEPLVGTDMLMMLADLPLIDCFEPAVLLELHRHCSLRHWCQGDAIETEREGVLILLKGSCEERQCLMPGSPLTTLASHTAGTVLGLVDYFGERPAGEQVRLVASEPGCSALVFNRPGFRNLLDIAPIFERSVIRDLALACESLQRSLQAERKNHLHDRQRRQSRQQPREENDASGG
jgi:hypothetical protein